MADADTLAPPPVTETPPPPAKPAVKAPPPPPRSDALMGALGGPSPAVRADNARIESLEKRATNYPTLAPPPPQTAITDPLQAFGQPAMWLAAFGSLMTRRPFTNAIIAAGQVMQATHTLDQAAATQAYNTWKVESENAIKLAKYEQDAYKAAISKKTADVREQSAEISNLNNAFKNAALTDIMRKEGIDGVKKALFANERALDRTGDAAKKFEITHGPEIDTRTVAAAERKIHNGGYLSEKENEDYQLALDRINERNKVAGDKAATVTGARLSVGGSPQSIQKAVESDLKTLHPEWTQGQLSLEAKSQIAAGTAKSVTDARLKAQAANPPLTKETADMEAKIMLTTGTVPGGGRLGQAAMLQVMNAAGEMVKGTGHTVEDYMAKRAEYKADTASLRALTTRTDALDAAAKSTKREFSDVVIPNIPKTPEPINMQLLTRWVRSGETHFGDVDVPVYMASLISGLDEYAKVLSGSTGAAGSTDASRAQAISVIPEGATTDQIKAIIERAIYPTIDIKIETYNRQKAEISARMSGVMPDAGAKPAQPSPTNAPPAAYPDAKKAPDGNWYVERNGKHYRVKPDGG